MKWLAAVLIFIIVLLQYRLWFGEGSLSHQVKLNRNIAKQQQENDLLKSENRKLAAEVEALKTGLDAIEARARQDMGMIKKGETFFMIVDQPEDAK